MGHYRSGYGLQIYNDIEARQFILNVYGARAAASFEVLHGPNRGDMFRYAILYHHGGICLDIKTLGSMHLDEVFRENHDDKLTMYTVLSEKNSKGRWIHNSIIAVPPQHPIMELEFNYTVQLGEHHHQTADTVLHFLHTLQRTYKNGLKTGGVYEMGQSRLVLYQETCSGHTSSVQCKLTKARDRYGRCCIIYRNGAEVERVLAGDNTTKPLFLTRDPTYPHGWEVKMHRAKLNYTCLHTTWPNHYFGTATCPCGCSNPPAAPKGT